MKFEALQHTKIYHSDISNHFFNTSEGVMSNSFLKLRRKLQISFNLPFPFFGSNLYNMYTFDILQWN